MTNFPPTEALTVGEDRTPVFIHLPCLEAVTWSEKECGPINENGCDRCDTDSDGQWREVRVRL